MSRKWVEKEGPGWVERGIVTRDQVDRILALYEDKKHAARLLPVLGSILVGLGILSFIAANWQDIPRLVRLALIVVLMAGFYGSGERAVRSGEQARDRLDRSWGDQLRRRPHTDRANVSSHGV
ncbi:DUF2157 domain-containing protein [Paenibacillus sp. P26]|nr:DUF2157 domain-containing protein [Paenibacillus sp. P26]